MRALICGISSLGGAYLARLPDKRYRVFNSTRCADRWLHEYGAESVTACVWSPWQSHPLEEFAETAFGQVGLDWCERPDLSELLRRPSNLADASRGLELLGRSPTYRIGDVAKLIAEAELAEAEAW
jgi:hypothetical protein